MSKKAILCTRDTDNIIALSQYLVRQGVEIVSSSKTNTGKLLSMNGVPFTENDALSDSPRTAEGFFALFNAVCMTGRRNEIANSASGEDDGIQIVCINLVPKASDLHEYLEMGSSNESIDLRSIALIVAACRNFKNVLVLCDPADYHEAIVKMDTDSMDTRYRLSLVGKALNMISACTASVSESILTQMSADVFPKYFTFPYRKKADLAHGSSAHQAASLYALSDYSGAVGNIKKLQGRELSFAAYINIDAVYTSLRLFESKLTFSNDIKSTDANGNPLVTQFTPPSGMVFTSCFSHGLPLSSALGASSAASFRKMYNCIKDTSEDAAAGFSAVVDEAAAKEIARSNFSVVIAPGFTADARVVLQVKKEMTLLVAEGGGGGMFSFRSLSGGLLVERNDFALPASWHYATKSRPNQKQNDEMLFGWLSLLQAKTYACAVVKDLSVTGLCCSALLQQDAVYAALDHSTWNVERGLTESTAPAEVLVCAAPLPFDEGLLETLASRGIKAILQSGGAKNDDGFTSFCDQRGISVVFTGTQHTVF